MDTWHHEHNPEGSTVEMHGNIRSVSYRRKQQQQHRGSSCNKSNAMFPVNLGAW